MIESNIPPIEEERLSSNAEISPFHKTDWKPAPYRQLKSQVHQKALGEDGYFVVKNHFGESTLKRLHQLYNSTDHIGFNDIGMFMSAYSADIPYRKMVHERLGEILEPELDGIFTKYKPSVYNFVVKRSRPEHALPLHQDLALVNEHLSSSINIWVCMVDTSIECGPVAVIPKTQYFFPSYRSKYSDKVIEKFSDQLKQYSTPIALKAGDLLVFDSRLIHYSLPNKSGKDRVAAVCYIYPQDSQFVMLTQSEDCEPLEFDLLDIERESLFTNAAFENEDKTGISGNTQTRVEVEPFDLTAEQLSAYFNRVNVPLTQSGKPVKSTDTIKRKTLVSENTRIWTSLRKFLGFS